jgi:hypothetical protein
MLATSKEGQDLFTSKLLLENHTTAGIRAVDPKNTLNFPIALLTSAGGELAGGREQ